MRIIPRAILPVLLAALAPVTAAHAAPGERDPSFGTEGVVTADLVPGADEAFRAVEIDPSGRIVAAGSASAPEIGLLARYTSDGEPDSTFGGGDGVATLPEASWRALATLSDGSVLAAGSLAGEGVLARYTAAGVPDPVFGGGDGLVTWDVTTGAVPSSAFGIALQPGAPGRYIVGVEAHECFDDSRYKCDSRAVRLFALDPSGSPEPSFGTAGTLEVDDIGVPGGGGLIAAADGSLAVGGSERCDGLVIRRLTDQGDPLWRVNRETNPYDGYCEISFPAHGLAFLADGGVAMAAERYLLRTTGDGELALGDQHAYGRPYSFAMSSFNALDVAVIGDGDILVPGDTSGRSAVSRRDADNRWDPAFAGDGLAMLNLESDPGGDAPAEQFAAIAPDGETSLVVAGHAGPNATLARLKGGAGVVLRCGGARATLQGTSGDDELRSNLGVIVAMGGDDQVEAWRARVCGGGGDDRVEGARRVFGGSGADTALQGERGDRLTFFGGRGDDRAFASQENFVDQLHGGPGRDILRALGGRDRLFGEDGPDVLHGGGGPDRLMGGGGPDRLLGGTGPDGLIGGPGRDVLRPGPTSRAARFYVGKSGKFKIQLRVLRGEVTWVRGETPLACSSSSGAYAYFGEQDLKLDGHRRFEVVHDRGFDIGADYSRLAGRVEDGRIAGTYLRRMRTTGGGRPTDYCGTLTPQGKSIRFAARALPLERQFVRQ